MFAVGFIVGFCAAAAFWGLALVFITTGLERHEAPETWDHIEGPFEYPENKRRASR